MRAITKSLVLEVQKSERDVSSTLGPLDDFLGVFKSSSVNFIDSASEFLFDFVSLLCVQEIKRHDLPVVFLDGGNSIDPFVLANLAKRFSMDREYVLSQVHVSRPFTAYQMSTLIGERLEDRIQESGAGMLVVSCFPALYLDEDLWWPEALELVRQGLSTLKELTERWSTITLVTNYKLSNMYRRSALRRLLYTEPDKIVRFENGVRCLRIVLPREEKWMSYVPVAHNQTTLTEYQRESVRIVT
ncbi:MAG: hypothetical protein ACE5IJ_00505 [Thermoplasmata archaeon]